MFLANCHRRSCLCLEWLEARCLPSTVTNLSDSGPGSLRDAIAMTPSGGTVDFQAGLRGTITLTTGELAINKDLSIDGPGPDVITVSGNNASRVFNIANFTVAISGLTIADGKAINDDGGGMLNAGTLTILDAAFSGNTSDYGGGLYNYFGMLTIIDSSFSGNSALSGGGVYNYGTMTVTGSTFSGNSAKNGEGGIFSFGTLIITGSSFSGNSGDTGAVSDVGGMTVTASIFNGNSGVVGGGISNGAYLLSATLTIIGCTFSDNSADPDGAGGGICNQAMLTIIGSTFSGNSADFNGFGGAIDNEGTLTVTASTISGNSGSWGGGIANGGLGQLTVLDSTLSGNSVNSEYDGGGIFNQGTLTINGSTFNDNSARNGGGIFTEGPLKVVGSTLSGNSAKGAGGGIYSLIINGQSAPLRMQNTLLAGNKAVIGGGPDVDGPLTSLGHNLIGDGSGGSGYAATDLAGTSANPIDAKLGPLQDNGGPTQTMALLPGSPAINAGGPSESEWDQRGPGYPRTVNGMTDIGAYEVQPSGAGSAALILHPSEPTHTVPTSAHGGPTTPSIPLRPVIAAVDCAFVSVAGSQRGFDGPPQHPAMLGGEMDILQRSELHVTF
jgi:hypothetical protein